MAQRNNSQGSSPWQEFLSSGYGADALGTTLVVLALACGVVNLFANQPALTIAALVLAVAALWRMRSRNFAARAHENERYLKCISALRAKLSGLAPKADKPHRSKPTHDASHTYLTCPNCHATTRVPSGKGKLRVTCPTCHHKFTAQS